VPQIGGVGIRADLGSEDEGSPDRVAALELLLVYQWHEVVGYLRILRVRDVVQHHVTHQPPPEVQI